MASYKLMVLGTSSDCGKSLICTGLCRLFHRAGYRVSPFKAQNMSNNAASTPDGYEIGRAQYVQAVAAGITPSAHHNPVLLKPTGNRSSQVIVQGKVWGETSAIDYHRLKEKLWEKVTESFDRVAKDSEIVILEGAGSCAELNLKYDFTNLKIAEYADADCILVGNIDPGGIFAQLIGTLDLLPPHHRKRFIGTIINKFRGDESLLEEAIEIIEQKTGIPVLGILPYVEDLNIEEEDSLARYHRSSLSSQKEITIAVLVYPRISNFTDLSPFNIEPDVRLIWINILRRDSLPDCDVLILPGSKNTLADLKILLEKGYGPSIRRLFEKGTEIVGLCGGLQMLGRTLSDPHRIESSHQEIEGLSLLNLDTKLEQDKKVRCTRATFLPLQLELTGYEIHCGRSEGTERVIIEDSTGEPLGFGREEVWGSYLHDIFANDSFRHQWLNRLRERKGLSPLHDRPSYSLEKEIDRWADVLSKHLSLPDPYHSMLIEKVSR